MSRYSLKPLPGHADIFEVAVGWDPGLDTFFLTIFGVPDDNDDPDVRLWRGTYFREIPSTEALLEIAGELTVISADLVVQLEADQVSFPHDHARTDCRISTKLLSPGRKIV